MAGGKSPRAGRLARRGLSDRAAFAATESLLRYISDIVCRFDTAARHNYMSPNGVLLGIGKPEEVLGRSHRELGIEEPFPSIWEALIRNVVTSGCSGACDIPLPGDDDTLWYSWRLYPEFDARRQLCGVVAVGRDITERRRNDRALRELTLALERRVVERTAELVDTHRRLQAEAAERQRLEDLARKHEHEIERIVRANLLSGMASGLAHELNQPLSAALFSLSGCIRSVQTGGLDRADSVEALSAALGQVRRAGEIVRHVLDLTRRHIPAVRPIALAPLLAEVAALLRLELHGSGIVVETRVEERLPPAHADRVQIEQVVLNLGRNAIDSVRRAGAGGVVTLSARHAGKTIELAVHDDGPGFAPDALAHIFEPFYTTKDDGVGLGLSICRSIVEETGGRIRAENDPERGACVRFTLPIEPRRP